MIVIGVVHDVCGCEIMHKPRNHQSILLCLRNTGYYHQWAFAKEITLLAILHKNSKTVLLFPPTHTHTHTQTTLPHLHMLF